VAEYLPQPALIRTSDLVITHGGNNTVTEALTAGVPLLVGPLSTDQFAAAADIESAGLGEVFDPNFDDATSIAALAQGVLAGDAVAVAGELGQELRRRPGHAYAARLIDESMREWTHPNLHARRQRAHRHRLQSARAWLHRNRM
jgi:UDP:flavonoid glycosyltransferase YjiC (YdhE family)